MNESNLLHLSAVRLVGFHNYSDVLLPVRGDLFVVGANESGKTTILDAIHLALSGEQHLDWNAAASLTGPKQSGRSFQGVILRADLAGQPMRMGGSIAYAAVELRPARPDGKPLCLVFGASAVDMHTQVHRWAAIVNASAADVPFTVEDADGTYRILDRDEFEIRLESHVYKSGRGIGDYRTAIAERLFAGRREFDEVTALWRTAKSYRELARTARSIGDVIRRVLPAPDPEPFQKIAKGFRDVAEIEEDLQELSRDVEQVHRLRTLLVEAREARESLRRYHFVQAVWRERELREALQNKRAERQSLADRIKSLGEEIDNLAHRISSAKERLATLRDSDSYKLVANLEASEERLKQACERVGRLNGQLAEQNRRLQTRQGESEQCRVAANTSLTSVRTALDSLAEHLLDVSIEITDDAFSLLAAVPKDTDAPSDVDAITRAVSVMREHLTKAIADLDICIRGESSRQDNLRSSLSVTTDDLRRLTDNEDLVPAISGLDEVLATLHEHDISYEFLYQRLEWKADTPNQVRSAVEGVLGLSQLATLVVAPQATSAARQVVLDAGLGLRILDATPVPKRASADASGHHLLDFVVAADARVDAHLSATLGDVVLVADGPPDGADTVWFAEGGEGGARGARWRLSLVEPCWIGALHRHQVRLSKISDLTRVREGQQRDLQRVDQQIDDLGRQRDALDDCLLKMNELQLPWALQQHLIDLNRARQDVRQLESDIEQRNDEILLESRQRDELSQSVSELMKQLEGTDAQAVKKAVEELESNKSTWEGQLVDRRADQQTSEAKGTELDSQLVQMASALAGSEFQTSNARNSLAIVVAEQHLGNLDHYVFETKRGGQLKRENLEENIRSTDRREAELLNSLRGADGVMNDKLATRYGFRVEDDSARLSVRDRTDLELDAILNQRREQERQMHESLNEKTRNLFETIFARDLTERLRADLLQLRRTISDINKKLSPLVFGHSRFQLATRPVAEHRRLLDLVERQAILDSESKEELRHYLEDRRDQLLAEGDVPQFLDYRFWFDYSFKLEHIASDSMPSLGSEDVIRGSVGAQTTHNYLLLLALAALLFDRCKARLRLLMLDDAFYGLDPERKELLLRCGKQLGVDFAIATPDLDGTIHEHAGDSTTVLVEKDEHERVSILPFEWERIRDQGELFPEARPEAILGRNE